MDKFDIRNFSDQLTLDGGSQSATEFSYLCPNCGADNFKVCQKTGKYQTFGCDCASTAAGKKAIRDKVAPLLWEKPARPEQTRTWVYCDHAGNPIIRVSRTDFGDGKREFRQQSLVKGKQPKDLIPQAMPYNFEAAKAAQERGERVLLVEGEGVVDAASTVGLVAVTTIGGSNGYNSEQYRGQLDPELLVICPDRDKSGLKYADQVALDYPQAQWLYALPNSPLWQRLPKDGGLDLADWIEDLKRQGLDSEQIKSTILAAVEDKRNFEPPSSGENPKKSDENDEQEEQEFLGEEVNSFLATAENEFDISTLLFGGLAEKFKVLAERLGLPAIVYVFCFLPVAASLLKVKTRLLLLVAEATNYLVPAIIWLALVADSGVGKSIVFNHITGALVTLELELREQHKAAHAEWKKEHEAWKELKKESPGQEGDEPQEPQPRTLFFDDFTFEAVGPALEKHPNCGAVVAVDELAGFLKRMEGEYKSGNSSERPKWLSAYNGGTVKNDRATKKGFLLKNTSISQIGTIQPSVLKRCMGNLHDVDGFWARYGFIYVPDKEMPSPIGFGKYDLSEYLLDIYKKLDKLPAKTYRLSAEAQTVWDDWHKWIEGQRLEEPRPVIKALYPKLRDMTARVALVVHSVNGVLHWEEKPKPEVSADTLKVSIEFAKFCLGQALFIYGQAGISNHADSAKIARFIEKFKHREQITPRMIRNWSYPKMKSQDCRKFMAQLVTLGYATDNGLDCTDKNYQITLCISSKIQSIQSTFPETQARQAFEPLKTQSIVQSNGLPFQSKNAEPAVQGEQCSENGLDSQSNGLGNGLAQILLEALPSNGSAKNGLNGLVPWRNKVT